MKALIPVRLKAPALSLHFQFLLSLLLSNSSGLRLSNPNLCARTLAGALVFVFGHISCV